MNACCAHSSAPEANLSYDARHTLLRSLGKKGVAQAKAVIDRSMAVLAFPLVD